MAVRTANHRPGAETLSAAFVTGLTALPQGYYRRERPQSTCAVNSSPYGTFAWQSVAVTHQPPDDADLIRPIYLGCTDLPMRIQVGPRLLVIASRRLRSRVFNSVVFSYSGQLRCATSKCNTVPFLRKRITRLFRACACAIS